MGVALAIGAIAGLASAGYSAYSGHEERKEQKKSKEEYELNQAALEKQAREAEAEAERQAKEAIRLQIDERKRASTWKTRDEEEEKLGIKKTVLGRN